MPLAPFGSRPAHVVEFGPVSVEHRVPQILKSGDSCSRQMPEGRDERKHGNVLPTPLFYSCALAQLNVARRRRSLNRAPNVLNDAYKFQTNARPFA